MDDEECALAYSAGPVHDIGHLTFSDSVFGCGGLTDLDCETIKRHPEVGSALLLSLGLPGDTSSFARQFRRPAEPSSL